MHFKSRTREVKGLRVVVGSDLLDLVRCHHDKLVFDCGSSHPVLMTEATSVERCVIQYYLLTPARFVEAHMLPQIDPWCAYRRSPNSAGHLLLV